MLFEGNPVGEPAYFDPSSAWLRHGPFGMWLVHALQPRKIVELGTHHGYSYFCFCQTVAEAGLDTRCFAVDTWKGDEHAGHYDHTVFRHVQEINAPYAGFSTLLRKTFAEALDDIEDGSVDLLHVDGRHFYEDVKEDFESWIPKLSPRAVVLFHDTEVRDRGFDVWRYWSEIASRKPSISFPYQHGLGVLFWGDEIAPGLKSFVSMIEDPEQIKQICEIFETAGNEVVNQAETKILHRDLAELRGTASALEARAIRAEEDLAAAFAMLHKERRYPLQGLRNKLAFKLLRALTKASAPLSAHAVARFQRSADKRSPDRGLSRSAIRPDPTRSEQRMAYRQAKLLGTSPAQPPRKKPKSKARTNIAAVLRHPLSSSARRAYRRGKYGANSPFALAGRPNEIGAIQARRICDNTNPSIAIPFRPHSHKNALERIAVIAHVFYPDIFGSLLKYIANIPQPVGLFISTDCETKRQNILAEIPQGANFLEIDVRVVPNRGRDIAPKLVAFRDVYENYPIFLHLHSKKSLHAGAAYMDWRDYLLNSLVGSPEIVSSNLDLLCDPNVGIVYPEHADFVKPAINWGYDFDLAKDLLQRAGVKLNANHTLEFPSGSMYWGRSTALTKLLNLKLGWLDFPDEQGQVDGTLAHAIERSLLYFVEASGYKWVRTHQQISVTETKQKSQLFHPLLTSDQDYLPVTATVAPETTRITSVISDTLGPRLNLLVPSLNAKDIFGGIDTALKVFLELTAAYPTADCRILVTDARVQESLPDKLQEYELQRLGSEERRSKVIVDCTDRVLNSLELTRDDIFVATAWWTAVNAYRMQESQKILFGQHNRVIYLIQDYEPGFYAWSTRYSLADSTYRKPDDTVAIFNSEELTEFMLKRHEFPHKWVLPYRPNERVAAALETAQRERVLLFYSRPSATRNCFEAGVDGIGIWARRNPTLAAKWKVYCIGEAFPDHLAEQLGNVVITGKMPLDVYAALLSRASVGISLMVSPHPSYPPLEMAYAGIRTITNNYESKDLSKRSDNITTITEITPEAIADAIENEVNRAEPKIGKVTETRCLIKDLSCRVPIFSAQGVLANVKINVDDGMGCPAPSISATGIGACRREVPLP